MTAYVEKHEFSFDAILDENVNNDEVNTKLLINSFFSAMNLNTSWFFLLDNVFLKVYLETVEPIIPTLFQQTKATCFAYGQTGSFHDLHLQAIASDTVFNFIYR